jgi:hypothetical protein
VARLHGLGRLGERWPAHFLKQNAYQGFGRAVARRGVTIRPVEASSTKRASGLSGGAELPPLKNLDQFLRKMPTDCFQVFGRIAGQQNAGPLANFADAPEFVEEFQNDFGMERGTELLDHIQIPQVP